MDLDCVQDRTCTATRPAAAAKDPLDLHSHRQFICGQWFMDTGRYVIVGLLRLYHIGTLTFIKWRNMCTGITLTIKIYIFTR